MPFQPTVLIIKYGLDHQMVLDVVLQEAGWPFHIASMGPEGIDLARQVEPNVILVDLSVAPGKGFGVINALKTSPTTKNIPIIALSAAGLLLQHDRALKLGADDVWAKPFDLVPDLTDFLYQY